MATLSNIDIARAIYLNSKDKSGTDLSHSIHKTVQFLYRKNLLSKKEDIISKLQKIINTEEGVIKARILSAQKLDRVSRVELINFLKTHYRSKEVLLEENIDEKLLGGIRIEINNEVIDLTIKNKIRQLQKHLTGETERTNE